MGGLARRKSSASAAPRASRIATRGRDDRPGRRGAAAKTAEVQALARTSAELRAELARSGSSNEELVATFAHDIKNPLSVMLVSAKLLERALVDDPAARRHVDALARAADEIQRSLQEMLDACRLERGTYQRGKESAVDLGPIVERALALAAPNIASKRITLAVDQRPVAAVWGDADRLSHVVQRFVTGALRYSPKGTSVSVELTRGADRDGLGRDGVVFGIRDGGAGLTAQALGCLFTRDGGGSRPTPQGAGLGYFVARGVIEALGGEVFAENTPEGGARFGFWLPAASE